MDRALGQGGTAGTRLRPGAPPGTPAGTSPGTSDGAATVTIEPLERHPDAPAPGTPLGSHYAACFGCGDRSPSGLHLQVMAGEGVSVTAEFLVTADHQGAPGLAHGGLLACALDEALGSLTWLLRRPAVTGHLETDFLRPVPVGSRLYIRARGVGASGRKVHVEAEGRLDSPGGPVAVRAAAVFVRVELAHFREHADPAQLQAADADPALRAAAEVFDVNP